MELGSMDFVDNSWTYFGTKPMSAVVGRGFSLNIDNNDANEYLYYYLIIVTLKRTN
jgi:hypothetical protein